MKMISTAMFLAAIFMFVGPSFGQQWNTWDASEFPELNYFAISGSGSRQIISIESGNNAYRAVAATGGEGFCHTTKADYWADANSTIEFRMKIESYNAGCEKAFYLLVRSDAANWVSGFIWIQSEAEDCIRSAENSAKYVKFNNHGSYVTYRVTYEPALKRCKIYYLDPAKQIWNYLLTSDGYGSSVASNDFLFGDNNSSSAASSYSVDYIEWTNDGLPSRSYNEPVHSNYVYNASQGQLLSQANPVWISQYYQEGVNSYLSTDELTGERVLILNNTSQSAPAKYANYCIDANGGEGTSTDFFTMDLRMRLLDETATDQFALWICRPPNPKQAASGENEHCYHLRFSRSGVRCGTSDGLLKYDYLLGNAWHDVRITIDVSKANGVLYIDGNPQPVALFNGQNGTNRNQIMLGDGSIDVSGRVAISSIRWTNDELDIPISGGQLEIIDKKTFVTNSDPNGHLNFPKVMLWKDGVYWLHYSIGDHAHPENQTTGILVSKDGGLSWEAPGFWINGMNVHQTADDKIIDMAVMDLGQAIQIHNTRNQVWSSSASAPFTNHSDTVTLPWPSTLIPERRIIELTNGDLLLSTMGIKSGETKFRVMSLISHDSGQTWQYQSTVAYSPSTTGPEGYNEPVLVRLADNSILALMRTGSVAPLMQAKSTDGGNTWSTPIQIVDHGVFPDAKVLSDGTLVASSGRPGLYMLVDMTGTGNDWQYVGLYDGGPYPYSGGGYDDNIGCSYTSLTQISPNLLMLTYTESGLSGYNLSDYALPNKIVSIYIKIRRDGDINGDGRVDLRDLAKIAENWQLNSPSYMFGQFPFNHDGIVNWQELAIIFDNWLRSALGK